MYSITTITTMTKNLKFNRIAKDEDNWVQKIDDDTYFDAIKTNMKTLTELKANMTTNLVKKYIQFYKEAKPLRYLVLKMIVANLSYGLINIGKS